jgi:hypothetical protein
MKMSYNVKVQHVTDTGEGISVEATINGEPLAHTFPKGMGFFDESGSGNPPFIKKIKEKYERKHKNVTKLSTEEKKVSEKHFKNQEFEEDSETFKQDNNQEPDMEVDIDDPEEVRQYLKENMAEGYLSEDEGLHIDEFVDEYQRLLEMEKSLDDVVKEAVGVE